VTKMTTKVATKSIEEKIVSNEEKSNWKSIFNNVALSIEIEAIEATKAIETTNATNAIKATMNESTMNSNWNDDSDWDSDSNTKSWDDRESRIDESRNAEILFCFSSWHEICEWICQSHCEKKQKLSCHDWVEESSCLKKSVDKWTISKCEEIWRWKKL
jgi:hypothetical protein